MANGQRLMAQKPPTNMKKLITLATAVVAACLFIACQQGEPVGDKAAALINEYAKTIENAETLDSLNIDKVSFETQMNEFEEELKELMKSDPEEAEKERAKIVAAKEHLQEVITKKICEIYGINMYGSDQQVEPTDVMQAPEEESDEPEPTAAE